MAESKPWLARPVLAVRADPAVHRRIERLAARTRRKVADVTRDVVERGLAASELEDASGAQIAAIVLPQQEEDRMPNHVRTEALSPPSGVDERPKAVRALEMIDQLEARTPLPTADAMALAEMIKARSTLETFHDAVIAGAEARARLAKWRQRDADRKERAEAEKTLRDHDARLVAEAKAFERGEKAIAEARERGILPPPEEAT